MKKMVIPFLFLMIGAVAGYCWWHSARRSVSVSDALIVGTNAEYPPFSFMEHDHIVGFDIDVIQEISQRLGKRLQLQDMPFDLLLPKLQLGELHVVAAGMTATSERAKRVNFTQPYLMHDPLLIISLSGHKPIERIEDLKEKTVVVNEGYTADSYLSTFEHIALRRLASPSEAFLALQSGRADAFVAAQSSVQEFFAHHNKNSFHIHPLDNIYDNYALVVSKKFPDVLTHVEQALDAMKQDGTLQFLKNKWNLP